VIKLRHQQRTVWEGLFAEEVAELWEPWMRVVDELLDDEELIDAVYQAQGKRHAQSRIRGRGQTPAEVALRMLILKHVRNWSFETLEREVRANVVYRSFCRTLPPLIIPRSVKHLVLDLPIGSREGNYDVALLNDAGDEVVRTAGKAQLENHSVILRVEIDLGTVQRGSYSLGIRQRGLEWTLVPARVG
jgi:hypothetical protein